MSTLDTIDRLTHAFPQPEREEIGRWFGIPYAALRYQGTGSVEGLEFLYPFLNDSDRNVRRYALRAVGKIFRRTGADGLEKLTYLTGNRDLAIRDRSSVIVGLALAGEPVDVILDVLRGSFTHRNNFIRGQGTAALGYAADGNASEQLLPIFEERLSDGDPFVRASAIEGLAEAFARSGHPAALDLLAPFAPFPVFEMREGEPRREWHFRWRQQAAMHSDAASAIARIAVGSPAEGRALELLREYLHPREVQPKMGFEEQLTQRQGVGATSWLLGGKPDQAVREMASLLKRPKPTEPVWSNRLPQSALIFTLPGTFTGSGPDGIRIATRMLDTDEHPTLRCAILCLGVAASGTCDEAVLDSLKPYLSHPNGSVRDVANLAVGLTFRRSGRGAVSEILRRANLNHPSGPSTNYPLGVGLLFQGTADAKTARDLTTLFTLNRRRLTRYAALGVSLIYQGTAEAHAVELLLPMLETPERVHACLALLLVDFDEQQLATLTRSHCLADGPGAAHMFVLKHFIDFPAEHYDPWAAWL